MLNKTDAIQAYILAKDGNRPFLLNDAFTEDAMLQMDVQTDSIKFPPSVSGRSDIADTLVREFNQKYENIYTLCIADKSGIDGNNFNCPWLVVMTEKQNGALRIGCGRYDWKFNLSDNRVQSLIITINIMETDTAEAVPDVLRWVSGLPYPWCDASEIFAKPPGNSVLLQVIGALKKASQIQV